MHKGDIITLDVFVPPYMLSGGFSQCFREDTFVWFHVQRPSPEH